jgi:hypothetical protein
MNGIVSGGWTYVIAAYSVTTIAFVIYAATLWLRSRSIKDNA